MTLRKATIARRQMAGELDAMTELAAAGMLEMMTVCHEWTTQRFWLALRATYGPRIDDKVREACPGCRPGFAYACGEFPPLPLLEPLPPGHAFNSWRLDIDGVRHWCIGKPWQKSQADHLHDLGEIDGAEWRRYLAWKRQGFPGRYMLDELRTFGTLSSVCHLCW
jgi:hypothetical protein